MTRGSRRAAKPTSRRSRGVSCWLWAIWAALTAIAARSVTGGAHSAGALRRRVVAPPPCCLSRSPAVRTISAACGTRCRGNMLVLRSRRIRPAAADAPTGCLDCCRLASASNRGCCGRSDGRCRRGRPMPAPRPMSGSIATSPVGTRWRRRRTGKRSSGCLRFWFLEVIGLPAAVRK